ncbi:MAG: hypothetical protein FJ291_03170 [Planctomycetes bacterium]|nr:hypothetical protein [Planctomycetota bacterium]
MSGFRHTTRRRGSILSSLAALAIVGIMLSLVCTAVGGARRAANVAVAQARLRQLGIGFELYFAKHHAYPPPKCDLRAALAPFVPNPAVFDNPLAGEPEPGFCLSDLYRCLAPSEVDRPNRYITALAAAGGSPCVALYTGGAVHVVEGVPSDTETPNSLVAYLATPEAPPTDPGTQDPVVAPEAQPIANLVGKINLNPRNNTSFEFELVKPDGSTITHGLLAASNGALVYEGPAVRILVGPKGNGAQNGMTYNGLPYHLRNGATYTITGALQVSLRKVRDTGGMGQWWLALVASDGVIESDR